MDVAATSTALSAASGGSEVGVKMLKKAQELEGSQTNQLIQSIQSPNAPGQGQNLDVTA